MTTKELKAEIEALRERINWLESRLAAAEARAMAQPIPIQPFPWQPNTTIRPYDPLLPTTIMMNPTAAANPITYHYKEVLV